MAGLRHGFLVLLVALVVTGCRLFSPEPLRITAHGPTQDRITDLSDLSVWVEFSRSVPPSAAEAGIQLQEDGQALPGRFSWSGRRVTVVPDRGLSLGKRYELTVAATVEADDGVDLGREFVLTFWTRTDDTRPVVTLVSPASGATVTDLFPSLRLEFSRPVDRASVYAALGLSPSTPLSYQWDAGDAGLTLVPTEALKKQTVYTLKVAASLADTQGNTSGTDRSSWFTTGSPGPAPVPVSVTSATWNASSQTWTPLAGYRLVEDTGATGSVTFTDHFETSWGLEVTFDHPVVRENLESFLAVEPSWDYRIPAATGTVSVVRLVPQGRLTFGGLYTLTVRRGLTDADGNPTTDRVYRFRADGPGSSPPALDSLVFHTKLPAPNDTATIAGDHSGDYGSLALSAFTNQASAGFLELNFRLADGASLDRASVMGHFSITATDPGTVFAITAVDAPTVADGKQTVRVHFMLTRGGAGLVLFKLSSGLADTQGNSTSADQLWAVLG